jgi:archaellum component FlaC
MIEHSDKRGNVSMEMSCGNGIGEDNGLSEYIEELRKELESNNSILNACKETKKRLLPILESVKSELCQLNSHTLKSEIFDSMELENQILRVMACYTVCKSM